MATNQHILDNRTQRLVDYLQQHLPATQIFRVVSAYFSVYGYEALKDVLNQTDDIRFLFGDPASAGKLDPGKKESQSFSLTEDGLSPNRILQQKHLAKACAEWIAGHNEQEVKIDGLFYGLCRLTGEEIAAVQESL